jgi:hypothetical protein
MFVHARVVGTLYAVCCSATYGGGHAGAVGCASCAARLVVLTKVLQNLKLVVLKYYQTLQGQ